MIKKNSEEYRGLWFWFLVCGCFILEWRQIFFQKRLRPVRELIAEAKKETIRNLSMSPQPESIARENANVSMVKYDSPFNELYLCYYIYFVNILCPSVLTELQRMMQPSRFFPVYVVFMMISAHLEPWPKSDSNEGTKCWLWKTRKSKVETRQVEWVKWSGSIWDRAFFPLTWQQSSGSYQWKHRPNNEPNNLTSWVSISVTLTHHLEDSALYYSAHS